MNPPANVPTATGIKVVIQIPCFNEEHDLPTALACLPREIPGADSVEWMIINDGSSDRTVEVARAHGVDHVVDFPVHRGLARAFSAGLQRAIELGADVIVNTDADNQYEARDIPALVAPILEGRAEFVVGARPIESMAHFSPLKRGLEKLGSFVVRLISGTEVRDAPSGFRALSREAAQRINIFDNYTYTLESIIQAGRSNMKVLSVPIRVTGRTRPSRLIRSIPGYIARSTMAMARSFVVYAPGRTFFILGLVPFLAATMLALRWIALYFDGTGRAHVPSLVAMAVLATTAIMLWACGLLGGLLAINRRLLEDIRIAQRRRLAPFGVVRLPTVSDGS